MPSFSWPAVTMVGWAQVLKSGLHIALQAKDYVSGVRQSILAGGDTTSRQELPALSLLAMLRIPCRVELLFNPGVKEWRCGPTCGARGLCLSSTAAGQIALQESIHSEMACPLCRAHVVGALLGVQLVEEALPAEWQRKAPKYLSVKQMVHVVVVQRRTFVPFHINRNPSQQPDAE